MKYDQIIWDFNGTILDDVETGIISVNKLLRDRGLPEIKNKEGYRRVFCFPIKEYYRNLGFDFNKEPYEVIAPLWVEQYMINVQNAPMYEDVIDTLEYFKSRNVGQILLSATERNMLIGQLAQLGVGQYFDQVLGLDNIHAYSKQGLAEAWKRDHEGERLLMIGDTDHDLQVSRAIGAECVLVCRGHQEKQYLESLGTKVYDTLLQLRLDIEK